jgi:cephalosporin hydroxylase
MIKVDTTLGLVITETTEGVREYKIGTPEAFEVLSDIWIRSGWDNKYVYSFTWMGRPVIQLPEDMIRIQEIIYQIKPDVIIETGVAHGGSLIFYASLCKAMGKGRVLGVDIEIRPHNRKAIENHELASYINLIEGDSISDEVVDAVNKQVGVNDKVLVLLDSCHNKEHVLAELEAYSPLVSLGSYIVATDGIMEQVVGAPRTSSDWSWNNPKQAALQFVNHNKNFAIEEPQFLFNEGNITKRVTYWPNSFIKRVL